MTAAARQEEKSTQREETRMRKREDKDNIAASCRCRQKDRGREERKVVVRDNRERGKAFANSLTGGSINHEAV